jgi:glycosyltransferase involved in cell wall biosynthesis
VRRVLLDARMIQASGIGTYLRELLRAWEAAGELPFELQLLGDPTEIGSRSWPIRPAASPIYSVKEQFEIPLKTWLLHPKVIHIPHYNVPALMAGRCIVTVHDLIHLKFPDLLPSRLAYRYAHFFFHSVIPRCRRILTISEHTKSDITRMLKIPEEKISVIPLGTPEDMLAPASAGDEVRARLKLPSSYFLYVGNVRALKNVPWLIRQYREFAARTPGCPAFVIVGRNFIPGYDAVLKNTPGVHWLGELPRADLAHVYAGAFAFLFPSLYEGFGLPPLEAMACGVPVISSNRASLPEVIGDAGILLDPQDDHAWQMTLEKIIGDAALREKLSRAGRERAKTFRWADTAAKTRAVYESLL